MKIITAEILRQLEVTPLRTHENTPTDKIPIIFKAFLPFSSWTWYVTEGEKQPDGDWLLYGLVDGHEKELGYFSLNELMGIKKMGLGLERDMSFGKKFLSEVM